MSRLTEQYKKIYGHLFDKPPYTQERLDDRAALVEWLFDSFRKGLCAPREADMKEEIRFFNQKLWNLRMPLETEVKTCGECQWVFIPDGVGREICYYCEDSKLVRPTMLSVVQKKRKELAIWLRSVGRIVLFTKFGGQCAFCSSTDKLCVDHIVPLSRGGTNDEDNLRLLCRTCNSRKGAKLDSEFLYGRT